VFKVVNPEITLRGLKAKDWVHEIFKFKKGLKSHGKDNKKLIIEWFNNEEDKKLFKNINALVIDFINITLTKTII
jgi:hypothetical protein